MQCADCGRPIVDTARFCSFCGAQQRPSPQPQSSETSRDSPSLARAASEASDVTVILPRRRVVELVAEATQRNAAAAALAGSPSTKEEPTARRARFPALAIGGVAAVVIIGALAVFAFRVNRPPAVASVQAPARVSAPTAAPITSPTVAPMPSPMPAPAPGNEAAAAPSAAEPPSVSSTEAAVTVEAPAAATPAASDAAPPIEVPKRAAAASPKEPAARKNRRATPAPPPGPAPVPVEAPPPQPVEVAAPAPAPVAPPAPPAPKVAEVACADVGNPFSREICLWQECAKPEFQSHAECARFTGAGSQR